MECASKIVVSSQLERIRCRDSGEESAFALERVTEEEVFSNSHVDFQLFFDVDTETEADVVLGGSVSKRVRAEEIAVILADAILLVVVLVSILVVDIALCIKDRLLTATRITNQSHQMLRSIPKLIWPPISVRSSQCLSSSLRES